MPAHKHCELFLQRVDIKLRRQRSGTVCGVLHDSSDAHHPLSPVIKLGFRQPRKKERKKEKINAKEARRTLDASLPRHGAARALPLVVNGVSCGSVTV